MAAGACGPSVEARREERRAPQDDEIELVACCAAVWHAGAMFDAVVFAGGGNRCYWQGGFYEAAAARLGLAPKLVGASAGAFAAAYSLLGIGPDARGQPSRKI